jgi:RHS repeat-associated protein
MSVSGLAAVVAALAALAAATAAQAQDAPQVPSPLRVESDRNGVNLVSGKMTMEMPSLSAPGAGSLRFDRLQNAAPFFKGNSSTVGGSYSVHTGTGSSESFTCSTENDCQSVTGTGSTLVVHQFRQGGSGALWHFTSKQVDVQVNETRTIQYYASHVDYPDGERIDYTYDTYATGDAFNRIDHRPRSISSNLGFTLTIAYQSDTPGTSGWFAPTIVSLYNMSEPAQPIARLTYNGNTITDLGGRIYTCTGCSNSLAGDIETSSGSMQLPGEGSPALQVNQHPTAAVVASVVKDGVTWTYSYLNLRPSQLNSGWLYDQLIVDGPNGYHQVYAVAASNKLNLVTGSTDSIGRTTAYPQYDEYRPLKIVLPDLNEVSVGYDDKGNVIARTVKPKPGFPGLASITETAFVDTLNCAGILCYRPVWTRDGLNRQTDYAYNAAGQITEQTDPADQNGVRRRAIVEYETSPAGTSRRKTVRICGTGAPCGSAAEIRTEYQYWGNTFLPSLERRIDAAQGVTLDTTYGYDGAGRLLFADGPLPGSDDAVYNRYDVLGRKIWEIGPKAQNGLRLAKYFTYRSADDKLVSTEQGTITDPNNPVLSVQSRSDAAYDSRRNPEREWVSAGGVAYSMVQRSFQDSGRLDCAATRMNPAAFASLPASACALGAQGSYGADRITRNLYDPAGQLLTVQRAYGTPRQQDYAKYEYTANGKQKAVIDANGNRAELTYDGHDRQRRWIFPSNTPGFANPADYEEYGYDPVGNRTSLRKRDGAVIGYQYDALNRLVFKDVPEAGGDVVYAYDVRGLQLAALYTATGLGIASAYDGFGRQLSSTTSLDGTSRTYGFHYDAAGNRTHVIHPDGPWFLYDYDALGRMTSLKEWTGTTLVTQSYNAAGQRSSAAYANGAVTSYGYDPIGRLTGLTLDLAGAAQDVSFGYAYNPASQIVARTIDNDAYTFAKASSSTGYAVNGLNQYTQVAGGAVVHDPNGNLIQEGGRTLGYDSENRLVTLSSTVPGTSPATLLHDPQGRWRGFMLGATLVGIDMVGTDIVTLRFGSGPPVERYAFAPGVDEPMVGYDNAGTRYYFHADGHGNVVARSNAAGAAVATIGYDEYGRPSAYGSRFLHAGKMHFGTVNAYYNNARWYDYKLGRFLQVDPVGYDDQVNLYAYVGNDPVNDSDSTGMAGDCSTGSRLPGGAVNCMTIFSSKDSDGSGSGSASPKGSLQGTSVADRRSAEQINQFTQNPRASFTQSTQGLTLRVQRNGSTVSGTINKDGRSLRFTGRLADVPGRQAVRIVNLNFTSPRGTVVSSAPGTITIYSHRDRTIHIAIDHPLVIKLWPGVYNLVNEPAGDRRLNQ